jgi:hypothetical protein
MGPSALATEPTVMARPFMEARLSPGTARLMSRKREVKAWQSSGHQRHTRIRGDTQLQPQARKMAHAPNTTCREFSFIARLTITKPMWHKLEHTTIRPCSVHVCQLA